MADPQTSVEEQCIFCKIVKGDIESKKVYEDDELIAILDINPSSKGHLLIMPKKHYPIMPLIPPKTFKHLAIKIKELSYTLRQSLICQGTTLFIANGAAAGQQSNHFMFHLIPRENNDGLSNFEIKEEEISQDDIKDALKSNFKSMMQRYLLREGKISGKTEIPKTEAEPVKKIPKKPTEEDVIKLIELNPQLKLLIEKHPEEFKKLSKTHPELKVLFKDINISKIIKKFHKNMDEKEKDIEKSSEKEKVTEKDLEEVKEMLGEKKKKAKPKENEDDEVDLDDIGNLFR